MLWSHYYTLVTSDNTVTIMVTSHEVTEKGIEGSGKMISYNVYYTYYHKMNYSLICNIWTLGALSEV